MSLIWKINWRDSAKKDLKNLDRSVQNRILDYLDEQAIYNPKKLRDELFCNKPSFHRYRVEDYRIICSLEESVLTILVIVVGHRKEIYD